jgi:hypothetical protein
MPDIYFDVDSALSEVPINILPLLDDTDFKSKEESVVYNAAGLDLIWNFVTTAGAMTQTAVTPTDTGGNYDWVNQGNGFYSIEIPASGGASINNDTEGVGWFSGVATGVLPWRGPTIGFRRAALNDLFIDGGTASTNLEDFFDGTGYAGGTVKLGVDVVAISGDATAADNLEAATDGNTYNVGGGAVVAASVTGAVGSVTGAVGSVTGNVGGNVTGSVGSVASGGITAASIATGAIDADALATDAVTEIWAGSTAPSAATIADAVWDELSTGHTDAGKAGQQVWTDIDAILVDTAEIGTAGAGLTAVPWNAAWDAEVESEVDDALGGGTGTALTAIPWNAAWDAEVESEVDDALGGGTGTALTAIPWNAAWDAEVQSEVDDALTATVADSIPADGTRPSIAQAVLMITRFLMERSVSSTTVTVTKEDGSTANMTFTLDDATSPTSITRAT